MEMGTWVEFRPKGDGEEHRAAKLLFVSPKKTRYLFSDRRGQNVLELSRAEIVRRLRSGEAVRLDDQPEEPLFDRIMTGLEIGKEHAWTPVTPISRIPASSWKKTKCKNSLLTRAIL